MTLNAILISLIYFYPSSTTGCSSCAIRYDLHADSSSATELSEMCSERRRAQMVINNSRTTEHTSSSDALRYVYQNCTLHSHTESSVPGSNPRMLEKSLSSPADCIAYDLEDAVATNQKAEARRLVTDLLNVSLTCAPTPIYPPLNVGRLTGRVIEDPRAR